MRLALRAAAKLANIKIGDAEATSRHHPLLNEEIHIEEELINLEEAINSYHVAAETLKKYPKMRRHILLERRLILKHCIGLISRMEKGKRLPREYEARDTEVAIRKLVSLIVEDARRANYKIDDKIMFAFRPYLNRFYRLEAWLVHSYELLHQRITPLLGFGFRST